MDYREIAPPLRLAGLIKARWTLSGGGVGGEWLLQQATPDGCVEIIHRTRGASRWEGDQPETFVVGLVMRPASFEIGGDAAFEGLRLWPWAWSRIGALPLNVLHNRWLPHPTADFEAIEARLAEERALNAIGSAIIAAPSVAAMAAATRMTPRALQRWFVRHVGMPPRAYLRLLRFQRAFETLPGVSSLADHAARGGFADQAHMAREFRTLAGVPTKQAREAASGPFLD